MKSPMIKYEIKKKNKIDITLYYENGYVKRTCNSLYYHICNLFERFNYKIKDNSFLTMFYDDNCLKVICNKEIMFVGNNISDIRLLNDEFWCLRTIFSKGDFNW